MSNPTTHARVPLYWFFLAAILFVNSFVYYPALFEVARADQIDYLIEAAAMTNFFDLINYSYSYCRSRLIDTGDEILFRPLFYAVLSFQKSFFGYRFIFWQALCIGFHFLIVGQLLKLFWRIKPGFWAAILTLLFSLSFVSSEQATWHHMTGYTICLSFILAALTRALGYAQAGQTRPKDLWLITLYLITACFIYEYAVVATVLIFTFLYIHRRYIERKRDTQLKNTLWMLWLAPVLYAYMSFVDYSLRNITASEKAFTISVFDTIYSLGQLIAFGFSALFFPSFLDTIMIERMAIASFNLQDAFSLITDLSFWQVINIVAACIFAGIILLLAVSFYRSRKDLIWKGPAQQTLGTFGLTCAALAVSYLLMILVGRVSARSLVYMTNSLYHYYFVLLFFFSAFFAWAAIYSNILRNLGALAKSLIITFLCLLILTNGFFNRRFQEATRDRYAGVWGLYTDLENFVAQHKQEKDFSFAFLWSDVVNAMRFTIGHPILGDQKKGELTELLYRHYINKDNPKYSVIYFSSQGLKSFQNTQEAIEYLQAEFKRQGREILIEKKSATQSPATAP